MVTINYLKKSYYQIKARILKQLKALKSNSYYLKPTDWSAPRIYGQPKIHKPGLHKRPVVSYSGLL